MTAVSYSLPWQILLLPIRVPPRAVPGTVPYFIHEAVQVAAYLCTKTGAHPTEVAAVLGFRDRTTILKASTRVFGWLSVDKKLAARVSLIELRMAAVTAVREALCAQNELACGQNLTSQTTPEAVSVPVTERTHSQREASDGTVDMGGMIWPVGIAQAASSQPQVQILETVKTDAERLSLPPLLATQAVRWVYVIETRLLWQQRRDVPAGSDEWELLSGVPFMNGNDNDLYDLSGLTNELKSAER